LQVIELMDRFLRELPNLLAGFNAGLGRIKQRNHRADGRSGQKESEYLGF